MVAGITPLLLHRHLEGVAVVHPGVEALAVPAHVLVDTAAAKHRPTAAVIDRHRAGEHPNAGGPLDEDRVGREEGVVFLDDRLELVEERLTPLQPAGRKIGRRPANGDVAVREPRAAGLLEQVEDLLALTKRVEKRAESPQVEAVGPHPDEMAGDPV